MNTALTVAESQAVARAESPASSILEVISRAAVDPRVDIDKLERLLEMQRSVMAEQRKSDFMAALARCQAQMPRIKQNGSIDYGKGSKIAYAKMEDLDAAIRPIYEPEGFSVMWNAPMSPEGKIRVVGEFTCYGHTEQREMTFPPDTSGGKQAAQAVASSVAYGKRQISKMFWNLIEEGLDVDGANRADLKPITQDQADTLRDKLTEVGGNQAMFLKYMKVESFEKITAGQLSRAMQAIEDKRRK
ncbi:MAG TPA: hypothetical protein VGM43_14550 [Bryobacteraceae bacterium]|jgi:hypothetical protein